MSIVPNTPESPSAPTPVAGAAPPQTSGLRSAGRFLLLALLWGIGLLLLGRNITILPPWAVYASLIVFSVPVLLSSLYMVTVSKIHNLAGFESQGWLFRLRSGRVIATLLCTFWAIISTFFLLLQFHTYTLSEWLGFFAVIPLFFFVFWCIHRITRRELKRFLQVAYALRWACIITPFLAIPVSVALLQAVGGLPEVGSLQEAIALRSSAAHSPDGSALVYQINQLVAYYSGARLFLAVQFGAQDSALALLMLALGSGVLFFNAALILSCFLVPRAEFRRVFARLSDAVQPPHPEMARVIITSAIVTLLVCFVGLPTFASFEHRAQQRPEWIDNVTRQLDRAVVMIDDQAYELAVRHDLERVTLDFTRELERIQPELARSLDSAFTKMEGNVDAFLDWYYQLNAEYLRMLNLMSGQLTEYVSQKLKEHLKTGDPFSEYETALAQHAELQARHRAEIEEVLDRHRVDLSGDATVRVVQEISLNNLPTPDEMITLEWRAGAGVAGGLVTAIVVNKIVVQLYAKGVIQLAAQPLIKAALTRAAAVGGGMATGAAVGSVVPVFGTAVGAGIGAVIGLGAGIAMDYGLLKLEEVLRRDEFHAQIMAAIAEARAEMLQGTDFSGIK